MSESQPISSLDGSRKPEDGLLGVHRLTADPQNFESLGGPEKIKQILEEMLKGEYIQVQHFSRENKPGTSYSDKVRDVTITKTNNYIGILFEQHPNGLYIEPHESLALMGLRLLIFGSQSLLGIQTLKKLSIIVMLDVL